MDSYQQRYPDMELGKDFFDGKEKAFEEVFNRYHGRLYVYCLKFIDNREEARDIVIQTINKGFKKHKDFDTITEVRAFLYVAARNHCFDYLRHIKLYTEKNKQYFSALTTETETITDEVYGEYLHQLRQSIESLPERSREVIRLLYYGGLKYREVAQLLNISVDTVESQRGYAIKKLKKLIGEKVPC
jgi:RNA polymerase sigma-70 factor (family 1)